MKWSSRCRSAILGLAAALALIEAPPSTAQGRAPLFVEPAGNRAPLVRALPARARRARRLRVDTAALADLIRPTPDRRAATQLNLFPDVVLTIARERLETGRLGHTSWVGHVEGDDTSAVALTWNGGVMSGGIVAGGRVFELSPQPDGDVVAIERDPANPPPELPALDAPSAGRAAAGPATVTEPGSAATIDLLVLYTPAARDLAGGTAAIQAQLANAVAVTNTAFVRSGVAAALNAVGLLEVGYAESPAGVEEDLRALTFGGPTTTAVGAMRMSAGADLVALVTGRASAASGCGVAWMGPASDAAISVTEQACLFAGQWSFTHEIAHNFGARHAFGDAGPNRTVESCLTYACAYREGPIRTLMAYYVPGSAPTRLLNFSSAVVREPADIGLPTGNSLRDNARQLSESAGIIATFRAPTSPSTPPGVPQQLAASVAGRAVTISWQPPAEGGVVTGYELEAGSTPGASNVLRSLVAGSPLSIASVPVGAYFVRLRAVGPAGRGAPTPDLTVTIAGCVPPGPLALTGAVVGGRVSLEWTTPSGTAPFHYTIGAGSRPSAIDRGVFPMGPATTFTVAAPPGAYYVKAIAVNGCGSSPISNEILITVP